MPKINRMVSYADNALSDRILCVAAEIEEAFIRAGLTDGAYSGREILTMAVDLVKPEYQDGVLTVCTSWPDQPEKKPAATITKWTAHTPAPASHSPAQDHKLLRLNDVMACTGLKKSSIYAGGKAGTFPMPIKMSRRLVTWREQDIQQWIQSR